MQRLGIAYLLLIGMVGLVSACERSGIDDGFGDASVTYLNSTTYVLEDGLINVVATVENARSDNVALAYARCIASRFAINRGFTFARMVANTTKQQGTRRTATAIYSVTAELPQGERKLDAEVVAVSCAENGIPMV